jgi:hypothetical protein
MPATQPPGSYITVADGQAPAGTVTSTGTFFAVGLTVRGPVGAPIQLTSLNDFSTFCGPRSSISSMYDAADVFFTIGGGNMFVSRVVGPAATAASFSILDQSSPTPLVTIKVAANGPGADGDNLKVAVVAGPVSGSYQLVIYYNLVVVETSPPLLSVQDAVNWGTLNPVNVAQVQSKWVTITNLASSGTNPVPAVVSATSLTGGTDDNSSVTDAIFNTALAVFTPDLGPGQVAAPGRSTAATLVNVATHAANNNRVAALDAVLGATASTTSSTAATCQASLASAGVDPSYGAILGPWIQWPGIPTATVVPTWQRVVPPSAVFAGLCALNDTTNDCNVACAGPAGVVANALGVNQSFSASDRTLLNNAGVSVFRSIGGITQLYGFQTLALDPNWVDLANARFRMQLVNDCYTIANEYVFSQIDGAGTVLSAFAGALTDNLQQYYLNGSLYGATPAQAFAVDVGSSVNTPQTIAARQLNAVISVVMSPSAEFVNILIAKFAVTQTIPASAAS